jgi:sarcosine oxidase, subunit alpha
MPRVRPLKERVNVTLDGETIEADLGEPVVAALVAAGKIFVARSPKFHRPRGPACLRGACDGCLARIDDAPNTMTCMVPAREGMEIVSQNRLGPRGADLLRMTDWFFPEGMNHHELFAGVPGVQAIMQGFARRVAGLGRLPADAEPPRRAQRRKQDVLVVGGGPAGMAVAAALTARGRNVEVLDDPIHPGGGLRALHGRHASAFDAIRIHVPIRSRTTAGAIYGRDVLVVGERGAEVIEPRALVLACGAHDGVLAFEGNDLPAVMSARAAGWLFAHGVVLGSRIVIVVPEGGGPFGASLAAVLGAHTRVELIEGEPIAARGSTRVKGVRIRGKGGEQSLEADCLIVDAPRAPAYELCEQVGARLAHEPRGFVVVPDAHGRIADGVWATGEVIGLPFAVEPLIAHAERVAASIAG